MKENLKITAQGPVAQVSEWCIGPSLALLTLYPKSEGRRVWSL